MLPIDTDELKTKYKVYDNYSFLVNPNIIGKESFRELKRLRRMVITDFDFKNFRATKEIISETEYLGFDAIKNNQEHDETKKVKNTEFIIEENNNANNTANLNFLSQNKINNNESSLFDSEENLGDFWICAVF